MGLIAVTPEDISVGQPLPWMVYDQEGQLILTQGTVLNTPEQRSRLLAQKPMRELSWPQAANAPESEEAEASTLDSPELDGALASTQASQYSFQDMRLKVGDRIQLQPPAWIGQGRHVVKLIGYLDNVDLLISAPLENGMPVPLRENDRIIARYFSSEKAFGFSCTVQRVCKIPYHYLHLSFPDRIQGAVIRKSPRIRTQLMAAITKTDSNDSSKSGVLVNLSANGAMLRTQQPLLMQGDKIQIAFRVKLHNVGAHLTLNAIVRSMLREEPKHGLSEAAYNYGLQFQDLPPNDSVILQSLVYQQMIEQPQSLT
jgi:c-di-GMP-binding flagellar brake protein YcgR